jgi:hypothetical protein
VRRRRPLLPGGRAPGLKGVRPPLRLDRDRSVLERFQDNVIKRSIGPACANHCMDSGADTPQPLSPSNLKCSPQAIANDRCSRIGALRRNDKTAGFDAISRRGVPVRPLRIPPPCAFSRPHQRRDIKPVRAGRSRAEAKAGAERRAMLSQRRQTGRIRLRIRVDRQEIVVAAWSKWFRRT